jgi:hypothetical protein
MGFFRFMKSKKGVKTIMVQGLAKGISAYKYDFDYMSYEIMDTEANSYSDYKRKSWTIKMRVNPIRVYNQNSYFNFIVENFSFDRTKTIFQACLNTFKDYMYEFINLDDEQLYVYLYPDKIRLSDLNLLFEDNRFVYKTMGENLVNKTKFISWIKAEYTFLSCKELFRLYIDKIDFTDFFELSITCDVSLNDTEEKLSFFQKIYDFHIPGYMPSFVENMSVRFDPYDRRTAEYSLHKLPMLRSYLKLNDSVSKHRDFTIKFREERDKALSTAYQKAQSNDKYRGFYISKEQAEKEIPKGKARFTGQYQYDVEYIKEQYDKKMRQLDNELETGLIILKNVVRLEIDYRENRAIKEKYTTANFYELAIDNRKAIIEAFKPQFSEINNEIDITEAIAIISKKPQRNGIKTQTILNLIGLPFDKINYILFGLKLHTDTSKGNEGNDKLQKKVSDGNNKIRQKLKELRKLRVILGEGQNIVIQSPFRQALSYINARQHIKYDNIFNEINNINQQTKTLHVNTIYNIYNNSNSTSNNNIISNTNINNISLRDNNINSSHVSSLDKLQRIFSSANSIIDFERLNLEYSDLEIEKLLETGLIFEVQPAKYQRM